MSLTFYIQDWEKKCTGQKKTYLNEMFPAIDTELYPPEPNSSFQKDEKGWFIMEADYLWPNLRCGSGIAMCLFHLFGFSYSDSGSFDEIELNLMRVQCLRIINRPSHHVYSAIPSINLIEKTHLDVSFTLLISKIKQFLEMIIIAIKEKKHIYWA